MAHRSSSLAGVAWSGWPIEDAKAAGAHRYSGFVYVAEFSDGWIKVGCSTAVRRRMTDHAKDARVRSARVERVFVSTPHAAWRANESALIAECALHASHTQGNEYFRGLDFAKTVLFLEKLPQKVRTVEEADDMDERFAGGMNSLYGRLAYLDSEPYDPKDDLRLLVAISKRTALVEAESERLRQHIEENAGKIAILDKWLAPGNAIDLDTFAKTVGIESGEQLAAHFGDVGIFDRSIHAIKGIPKDLPEFKWLHCFKVFISRIPTGGFVDVAWILPEGQLEIVEELRNNGLIDF